MQQLGASKIIGRLDPIAPALGKQQWAGAIDTVGGQTLATLLKMISYNGCAVTCGLAGGGDLPTTVYPFILRGVSLVGIDSVQCPMEVRLQAWQRVASLLPDTVLHQIHDRTICLEEVAWEHVTFS